RSSERIAHAHPDLAGRLNLWPAENLRGRVTEIRIRTRAEGQRRPCVVILDDLLIEQVEKVRQDGQAAGAAHPDLVRRLEVDLALEWRARQEAIDGLHPRTVRGRGNLAAI